MPPLPTQLPSIASDEVIGFVLVLARVGGMFLLAPVFSSKFLPARAKLIAAGAISVALTPIALQNQKLPSDPLDVSALFVKEIGIGLAFALALGALGAAVQAGGSLLDTLAGFSFGAIVDPITGVQSAVFAQLYGIFATLIFVLTGGDHVMILGLARSYDLVPLGTLPGTGHLAALATAGLAQVFLIGLEIAAPVMIALLLADAAFGLVARAVPQMNVFVVGLPLKVILGFVVVGTTLPFVSSHLQGDLQQTVFQALEALRVR
jgi:flagellar biosynthesis protein FliR